MFILSPASSLPRRASCALPRTPPLLPSSPRRLRSVCRCSPEPPRCLASRPTHLSSVSLPAVTSQHPVLRPRVYGMATALGGGGTCERA
eukprot:1125504-Rhodomonas_salina.1